MVGLLAVALIARQNLNQNKSWFIMGMKFLYKVDRSTRTRSGIGELKPAGCAIIF